MRAPLLPIATLILLIVMPAPAHAAPGRTPPPARGAARALTVDDVIALDAISSPAWSRDGRRVAFVVDRPDTAADTNDRDVWLWDAEGGARRLTTSPKNDYAPQFSPGGDTLAFLSTRDSDEGKPSVWFLSLRGGEPWKLAGTRESVGELRWSPDGRLLAFTMLDTLPGLAREWKQKKWDAVVEDEHAQHNHLWIADVATGRLTRLTSGAFNVANPQWSPDSKSLAFIWSETGVPDDATFADLAIVPATGGAPRRLDVIPDGDFSWSPDGRWLAWSGPARRDDYVPKTELWVAPASGGRPARLTAAFDEDAATPVWSAGSDTLYFFSAQGVTTRVAAVARAGGAVTLGIERGQTAGRMSGGPGGRVAWVQSGVREPGELWIADHPDAPARRVSSVNATAATRTLADARAFHWTSDDGATIEGLLVRPPGAAPNAALKTLVLLHGGPYTSRYALGFQPMAQLAAARGYQVFMPNFRSSGGYGTAFMQRKRADWGGQDWRDVVTGIDALVKQGLADGGRLGVFGHSYGGYLSAWAITQTTRFKAAVVSAGAVDLGAHWGQSDIHRYRAFDFEGEPWKSFDHWRRASPIAYVQNVRTPTLVLSGEADVRVPYPQGQQLYQSLKFLGVPCAFVHYPREGHGLREPRHRADWFARQLDWFDRWIR